MKNNPLSIREQHTHKSTEEQREYELFIRHPEDSGTDISQREEDKDKEVVEEKEIPLIGERKTGIEETNKAKEKKKTIETKDLTPRNKKSKWEHFKNRWHRKWADNLVDLIFNFGFWIITTVFTTLITATATYFITKNNFEADTSKLKNQIIQELKQEIINKQPVNKLEEEKTIIIKSTPVKEPKSTSSTNMQN